MPQRVIVEYDQDTLDIARIVGPFPDGMAAFDRREKRQKEEPDLVADIVELEEP